MSAVGFAAVRGGAHCDPRISCCRKLSLASVSSSACVPPSAPLQFQSVSVVLRNTVSCHLVVAQTAGHLVTTSGPLLHGGAVVSRKLRSRRLRYLGNRDKSALSRCIGPPVYVCTNEPSCSTELLDRLAEGWKVQLLAVLLHIMKVLGMSDMFCQAPRIACVTGFACLDAVAYVDAFCHALGVAHFAYLAFLCIAFQAASNAT